MKKKAKKKVVVKKKAQTKKGQEIVLRVVQAPVAPITPQDLEPEKDGGKFRVVKSWLSDGQVLRMIQKTPANIVRKRKGRGGMEFNYVPGWYFKKALNFAFGWNWDFQIMKQEVVGVIGKLGTQVITTGRLTIKDDKGHVIIKEDNGKADIKCLKDSSNPLDVGNDYKASATDALKRCCVQLGIASDVYGAEELKQETGESVDEPVIQIEGPRTEIVRPSVNKVIKTCAVCDGIVSEAGAQVSKRVTGKVLCKEHYDEFIKTNKKK